MRLLLLLTMSGLLAATAAGGCDEAIEKYNPAEPKLGAREYPTPQANQPLPQLTRARRVEIGLVVDEHLEPDDHVILVNRSDGAVYDLKLTVNNDYHCTVPLIEMGDTVRVPESWLRTEDGRPFPSARRVRMERVEVRHAGSLIALYDSRAAGAR